MSTNLNLKYSVTFSASTKVIDNNGEFSSEDLAQQQLQFNSNSLINSAAKRIEVSLLPTNSSTPTSTRVYDIDLDNLNIGFIRMLYIKAEAQFLFSVSNTLVGLNTSPRLLTQCYVLDQGPMPPLNLLNPDNPYPKFIRLINPLEINGGGSGNSDSDIPLLTSVFLITTPKTPDI